MAKYSFRVLKDVVKDDWARNAGDIPFPATDDQLDALTLIVEAANEEEALTARTTVSNILAWELSATDE